MSVRKQESKTAATIITASDSYFGILNKQSFNKSIKTDEKFDINSLCLYDLHLYSMTFLINYFKENTSIAL